MRITSLSVTNKNTSLRLESWWLYLTMRAQAKQSRLGVRLYLGLLLQAQLNGSMRRLAVKVRF